MTVVAIAAVATAAVAAILATLFHAALETWLPHFELLWSFLVSKVRLPRLSPSWHTLF